MGRTEEQKKRLSEINSELESVDSLIFSMQMDDFLSPEDEDNLSDLHEVKETLHEELEEILSNNTIF